MMDTSCRRCGRWTWSESTVAVNTSRGFRPKELGSIDRSARDTDEEDKTSTPYPLNGSAVHLPQFSAIWSAGSEATVYSFGGSSSTDTSEISHKRRASGERCTIQAIGISDELWRFSVASGWRRVHNVAEDEGKPQRLWPRARYASTSWSVGDGQGHGLIFSGEFEFCYKRDYVGDSGTPPESTDVFLAPDSLFLFTPASHGRPAEWSLLGGSDSWNRVGLFDFIQVLQQGYTSPTYECSDDLLECAWPLPRSHSQRWTLSGKVYMFSGLFTVIDQSFEEARSRSMLLNDLWQMKIHSILPSSDSDKPHIAVTRVAACGLVIVDPAVLPLGGVYPGPRFSAATWSVPSSLTDSDSDSGWLFGGVGRLVSDRLDGEAVPEGGWPDGPDSVCNTDTILSGFDAVRNLCDLWVFVPSVGFRLVQACNVDVPRLRSFVSADFLVVPWSAAPTAGIFATTWVGQLSSLWMFGGLTGCANFDGVGPDGTVFPEWEQSKNESWGSLLQNMTMCDLTMRGAPMTANTTGSDEWMYPIAVFPGSHIDQPCTADMWRFSLVSETWVHVLPPNTSVANTSSKSSIATPTPALAWPLARCGAAALPVGREEAVQGSLAHHGSSPQLFIGGWGGSSSGECEEWPSTSNSTDGNITSTGFKGFLSSDVPTWTAKAQRRHVAQCKPMAEMWQFGLVEVPQ